jgi:hypothetical protein
MCPSGGPVQAAQDSTVRVSASTERRRSRTYPATGCAASPVLKTGWATGPVPLRGEPSSGERPLKDAPPHRGRVSECGYPYLERAGRLVRLGDGLAVGASAFEEARTLLVDECEREGSITLARFRDLIGGGRKQAQLLLERCDADGVTRRVGDARVLRRRAKSG